jgi:hypothetical protein
MKPRTTNDIWQGLYDFYLIEDKQLNTLDQLKDALVLLIKQHAVSVCGRCQTLQALADTPAFACPIFICTSYSSVYASSHAFVGPG